jgi:glycosyltransferase involved in cell wall biosynthesis
MKVIGLTRIRNESLIIKDTLDHLATFCDEIYVFDDASTDNTVEICRTEKKVVQIIENKKWGLQRTYEEFSNRQQLLEAARKNASPGDWFVYLDADERIEFDWNKLKNTKAGAVKMKLFDFYITGEDKDESYIHRRWLGPEYRHIIMTFKNSDELIYKEPDQREVILPKECKILKDGFVKHYGKAISIEEWEKTCDYYIEYFEQYSEKWKLRKGKAIHKISDFGSELITWDERKRKGIPITWVDSGTRKNFKLFMKRYFNILMK